MNVSNTTRRLTTRPSLAPWALAVLPLLGIADLTRAQSVPTDKEAIRGLVAQYERAWNLRDAASVASIYTTKAQSRGLDGYFIQGIVTIEANIGDTMALYGEATLALPEPTIRLISSEVAIADGAWIVTGGPPDTPGKGSYTIFFVKQENGEWKAASDRSRVLADPPKR